MILRRLLTRLLGPWCIVCLGFLSMHGTAFATPIIWTVTGTFDNGSALTGTLDFDATTEVVSDWNLTGAFNYDYTPGDSLFSAGACCTDQFAFIFTTFDGLLTLDFAFNPDLTDAGTPSSIAGGSETYQFPDRPATIYNLVSGGAVSNVGSVIPEPGASSYFVFALALALAGALFRDGRAKLSGALMPFFGAANRRSS